MSSPKRLLDSQYSNCSTSYSENGRITPSPISMLGLMQSQDDHAYANPKELEDEVKAEMDKIDGRKKRNLIYEPLSPSGKNNGFIDHSSPEEAIPCTPSSKYQNDRLYRFLFVVIFLLSLGAFVLSVLTTFGIITATKCESCKNVGHLSSSTSSLSSSSSSRKGDNFTNRFNELQRNISRLNNFIIPSLLEEVSTLQSKLNNKSFEGKTGPAGPAGPAGSPGGGDLSQCRYHTSAIGSQYPVDRYQAKKVTTDFFAASEGFTILSVTCSITGGSEHQLIKSIVRGKIHYQCACSGKLAYALFEAKSINCRIHSWECPLES